MPITCTARAGLLLQTAVAVLAVSCTGSPTHPLDQDPAVVGPVASISMKGPFPIVHVLSARRESECGIRATVRYETEILHWEGGKRSRIAVQDLKEGETVAVFVEGPVQSSCPMQGAARSIVRFSGPPR